jgi:predicted permease
MSDLRFALRQLGKSPGFTLVVILSLALGIAANTTVLCWLRALVLHPLPGVADQDRIVVAVSPQGGGNVSLPDLRDLTQLREVFAGGVVTMPTPACLTVDRQPQWIQAETVSANYFDVLGVRPVLGRTFLPGEDQKPGGNPVLVIGENLWRTRFGRDPGVLGRVVDLNRHRFTIIGVVPAVFRGSVSPSTFDAWAPASMIWEVRNQSTGFLTERAWRGWLNLVRLQPGVSLAQARAAVATVDAQLARSYPATNTNIRHRLVPLSECPWGAPTVMGPTLRLLLVVSAGVLLIVIANVANLLLGRAVSRRKEISIRLAAGANDRHILRQLLTESMLLAALGGLGGVLLATWGVDSVALFLPGDLSKVAQLDFPIDAATLGFTTLITVGTGLAFGILPALQASRLDLYSVLKEGGRSSQTGAGHHRLRHGLVVAEVAIALVLLISAGLCAKGLTQARRIDVGFDPEHVLLGRLQIGMNGYTQETGPAFYREARARIAAIPGVEEAALASWFPLGLAGCKGTSAFVEGYAYPPGADLSIERTIVSPRFFSVMRIPLVAGRDFSDQDDTSKPGVVIVNEAFAEKYWPGQTALGRRVRVGANWCTVVGVARTGKYNRLNEAPRPFLYLPYQQGVSDLDLDICVRTAGDPNALAGSLRQALRTLDPNLDVRETLPLAAYSSLVLFPHRLASGLLTFLGSIALLLAAMGVYAVMAYAVAQRTQEFGVRIALGARPADVLWQVVRRGLLLALVGVAIGLAVALAATQLMSGFLYGVSPFDPTILVLVAGTLIATALLACWLPARRATRVDPIEALRAE